MYILNVECTPIHLSEYINHTKCVLVTVSIAQSTDLFKKSNYHTITTCILVTMSLTSKIKNKTEVK
jgi:hypothetical protein